MSKGIETNNFPKVQVDSVPALWAWLSDHHDRSGSVWLVTYKKHMGDRFVGTGDVLDALIAYGWIDGIRRKLDNDRTMQLIAPRQTQAWAQSYKDRAARLIDEGRMLPPGLAAIDAAKANGLWDYWADVDALICPDDLAQALVARPSARTYFDASAPSYRRNLLRWVKLAKTDATRAKRIAEIVAASHTGEKIPQM